MPRCSHPCPTPACPTAGRGDATRGTGRGRAARTYDHALIIAIAERLDDVVPHMQIDRTVLLLLLAFTLAHALAPAPAPAHGVVLIARQRSLHRGEGTERDRTAAQVATQWRRA